MTEEARDEGAATTLQNLAARIDELTREVRRQGRAAVAAQAAAESCLERLAEGHGVDDGGGDEPPAEEEQAADTAWVHALLPVADALDRVLSQARAMVARGLDTAAPKVGGLWSMLGRAPREVRYPAGGAELRALAEGLRVLRAQLHDCARELRRHRRLACRCAGQSRGAPCGRGARCPARRARRRSPRSHPPRLRGARTTRA